MTFMIEKLLLTLILTSCTIHSPHSDHSFSTTSLKKEIQLSEVIVKPCTDNMNWVHGKFCTKVEQKCKRFIDPEGSKFARRCAEFEKSVCTGESKDMNFCIDKEEYSVEDDMPMSNVSWTEAKNICESSGKRLCSDPEWTFACEGENSVPYSTGLIRPSKICNMDIEKDTVCGKDLCDHRKSIKENPDCLSPFGIHNMSGNVDEFIEVPMYHHSKINLTMRSSLKGGHWLPVRNRCRPRTDDHGETNFSQISIGFRCCKDI